MNTKNDTENGTAENQQAPQAQEPHKAVNPLVTTAKEQYVTLSKRLKAALADGDWCCEQHRVFCDSLLTNCSAVKRDLLAALKAQKITEAQFVHELSTLTTQANHVFSLIELHQAYGLINMRLTERDLVPV